MKPILIEIGSDLLEHPDSSRIRVFGSAATKQAQANDLDICIDASEFALFREAYREVPLIRYAQQIAVKHPFQLDVFFNTATDLWLLDRETYSWKIVLDRRWILQTVEQHGSTLEDVLVSAMDH